jgi:hypothetical protein
MRNSPELRILTLAMLMAAKLPLSLFLSSLRLMTNMHLLPPLARHAIAGAAVAYRYRVGQQCFSSYTCFKRFCQGMQWPCLGFVGLLVFGRKENLDLSIMARLWSLGSKTFPAVSQQKGYLRDTGSEVEDIR